MNPLRLPWRAALAALLAGFPSALQPQGVAGAAVVGIVARSSGEPVPQARVILRNASTGFTREQRTGPGGRFVFEGVPPGGPYALQGFALGLDPVRSSRAFMLALGDRIAIDVTFPEGTTAVLPTVAVWSAPRGNEGGPAFSIPSEVVHGLPLLSRDRRIIRDKLQLFVAGDLQRRRQRLGGRVLPNEAGLLGSRRRILHGVRRTPQRVRGRL